MRTKIALLISTLMVSLGSLSATMPASATINTEKWGTLWTLAEAKSLYEEMESLKDATCGNDLDCRRNLTFELVEQSPKYAVAESYSMTTFIVSAVNPTKGTLKAYYRDLDFMAMEMEGEEIHRPLTELYILWLDSNYDHFGVSYVDAARGGFLVPGMHMMYEATYQPDGEDWFPVEKEVEIFLPDTATFPTDGITTLHFFVGFAPQAIIGGDDYSTCVNSPDYEPGMECRMMLRGDGGYVFLPFADEEDTNTGHGGDSDSGEPHTDVEDDSSDSSTEDASGTNGATVSSVPGDSSDQIIPLAPDTGVASAQSEYNSGRYSQDEFPWWLGIIFAVGIGAALWLFWPQYHASSKNPKKVQKRG